jgi:hypothetical protein
MNGIGLLWFPSGNLYQGNYKDDDRNGLQIIHYKADGNKADAEFVDNLFEGLYSEHTSDGIIWYTHSKD